MLSLSTAVGLPTWQVLLDLVAHRLGRGVHSGTAGHPRASASANTCDSKYVQVEKKHHTALYSLPQ